MELASQMLDSTSANISGDPTCAEPRYFSIIDGKPFVSNDVLSVLRARHRVGETVEVSPVAISHLLHDGFVSQPYTVYKGVFVLSMGMSATLENGDLAFALDFPFLKPKSMQDQKADPAKLLGVLTNATKRACRERAKPLLMLSAGLDSTSVALAVKEAGRDDTLCVTYTEHDDLDEAALARSLCVRLGLRHETFHLDPDSEGMCRLLRRYAAATPEPCADPALIACVAPVSRYADEDTVILDGSGNDAYFWKPPRRLDLAKLRFGPNRLPALGRIRRALPMYLRYERLLSTPLELLLFAGPHLRHCDTRLFYSESVDTHRSWLDRFNNLTIPVEEVRSSIRSTFMGPAAHLMKARNAAMLVGAAARFPWTDHEVADYCFNLPADQRFCRSSKKNKVIMREMLAKFVDYDEDAIGKRAFKFSKRRFVAQHLAFCREEILRCSLWEPTIGQSLNGFIRAFHRGAPTANALLTLLMVSLWHTHWIRERLPTMLGAPQAGSAAA
jgi:asparagine synthase (glutamine-hydrolysing)